jgi:dUTPase
MVLKVKRLHPDAFLPTRGSAKSSGLDLYALEDTWIS